MSFKSTNMAHRRDSRWIKEGTTSHYPAIVPKDMKLYITMEGFRWALSNGGVI